MRAVIVLDTNHPRAGAPLEGHATIFRGARAGDVLRIEMSCWVRRGRGSSRRSMPVMSVCQDVRAAPALEGARAAFRFDVPVHAPPTLPGTLFSVAQYQWRVEICRRDAFVSVLPPTLKFKLMPVPEGELQALKDAEPPEVRAQIDRVERARIAQGGSPLMPYERVTMRAWPARQRAESSEMFEKSAVPGSPVFSLLVIVGLIAVWTIARYAWNAVFGP